MIEPIHYSRAAVSYAKALIELADEQKLQHEAIGQELAALRDMVAKDETFRLYLADPSIATESRWALLKRALSGRVSPLVLHLLGVLNEKGRLALLREVSLAYEALLDEKLGKVQVEVIVAHQVTNEQIEEAKRRVSAALKRDAVVHPRVDESIIGGLIVRVGDKLIDASVKSQLQLMKEKLLAARPN
jgi:F-type H+-transporting ATPase subunit delta